MNMKTVEGLVGARTNINLSDTAMGVYQEASQKGDTAAMERALGYAGQMTSQAEAYEAKAEEGMKADAKERKEQAKADQEKLIEKRRENQEQLEARIEKSREAENDIVQISAEGKAELQESAGAEGMVPADSSTFGSGEIPPVVYSSAGEVSLQTAETEPKFSVLA